MTVNTIYRDGFEARFAAVEKLWYDELGWGDAETAAVARVLASGAAPKLKVRESVRACACACVRVCVSPRARWLCS